MRPKEIFNRVRKENRTNLTESEAREVFEYYRIPIVPGKVVQTTEEAIQVAEKIGYPLVLKVVSKKIIHKTDVGGVILGIKNEKELRDGFQEIIKTLRKHSKKAVIDGIFVQKMLEDGVEVFVGGKWDQTFDQVIAFGLGGVFVEVFDDVTFRVVPITERDAVEMIREIKGFKILRGYRGKEPVDFKALVHILMKTSRMLEENQEIKELDINPIFALPSGAVAVDARIVIE